ncbi:hypothetical protein KVR01_011661 [Diaporthe batatas]|uniref:uncharacterized protein n=1 Tax=Diaporthe batatas TaxID=748121 RepID=UPI001D050E50|nr:uncharacterized protein KVR01_011661 [Diaporthe batatas]KAG8158539.1 hypothetical protein KVR01_011661 [Diaporthe batatas]
MNYTFCLIKPLRPFCSFEFFTLVPTEGDISLEELAKKAGLDQDRTNRAIRMLITQRIFQETKGGYFAHNAFSIALQRDKDPRSMVHYSFDETLKASANTSDAIKKVPFEADSVHWPFYDRFGIPIFNYYKEHPEYSARFAKAMQGWRKLTSNINELRDNYPWADLQGTVVDIGGGSGHVAMELARAFPHLKFAVQDGDASMLAVGEKNAPADLRDRLSFTQANFFTAQQYKGAAAYLIRQCTHNWADHDVITMLKAIVPGLEGSAPGTPLLINDMIMPEPGAKGVPRMWERERRQADMVMLVCYGAKQRTISEFQGLLKEADPRYAIRKVHAERGALGILEVFLDKLGQLSSA